jgi:hypothetical protein
MNEDASVRNCRGRICALLVALAATLFAGRTCDVHSASYSR